MKGERRERREEAKREGGEDKLAASLGKLSAGS
jgi:hypothetical protein